MSVSVLSGCTASRSTRLPCPGALSPTAMNEISIISNLALNGAGAGALSASASTADCNVDGALCLRRLTTGINPQTDAPLTGNKKILPGWPKRLEKYAAAPGCNRPVTGRADALIPVNHAGFVRNQPTEEGASRQHYIEITNDPHFDVFLALSGFPARFIPQHLYAGRAPDTTSDNLYCTT